MRQIGISDLLCAARAVQAVPRAEQVTFAQNLIWQAHVADKYVKRVAQLHPEWGDGSLRACANLHARAQTDARTSVELHDCMTLVLSELSVRRSLLARSKK